MSQKKKKIKVLVTAGPTRAYLDDLRYISNYSSGELGKSICEELSKKGFSVAAVVGPVSQANFAAAPLVEVETVDEMHQKVVALCRDFKPDYIVLAAAVLDFIPKIKKVGKVSSKIKKWTITLVPSVKIVDEISKCFPKIKKVGFKLEAKAIPAAEIERFAASIIKNKKLEALCLNFLPDISKKHHSAFFYIKNKGKLGRQLKSKDQIAKQITQFILCDSKSSHKIKQG